MTQKNLKKSTKRRTLKNSKYPNKKKQTIPKNQKKIQEKNKSKNAKIRKIRDKRLLPIGFNNTLDIQRRCDNRLFPAESAPNDSVNLAELDLPFKQFPLLPMPPRLPAHFQRNVPDQLHPTLNQRSPDPILPHRKSLLHSFCDKSQNPLKFRKCKNCLII